ncbi:hypothetical protein [Caulobacter sp. UNC358MFTsu5.1]|uniref:hypothetical protein n=1 Tax=Caulobacter sp. UNC358MFTsu5.1 TaxID=1449049 RepID=UPI0004A700BC|nr:hypothetical protein [Caulobacter sp. UNC358MFTsu5.1]
MAQYSVTVVNNSDTPGTYALFQAPPPGAPAQAGWSISQTIAPGSSAKMAYAEPAPGKPGLLAKLCALLFPTPPKAAPGQFRLTVDPDGSKPQTQIDFAASPTAPTKILHGLDGALSLAAASTLGYSVFTTPDGNVEPTDQGDNFMAAYSVVAIFTNSAGSSCANGEYRQMVRGQFSVNGSVVLHILCEPTVMSPAVWQQDGCPPGVCTAYGYRACPPSTWNAYKDPDQSTGSQYAMFDQPGFRNIQPGFTYTVDLQFQGQLVDTAANVVLATRNWTVAGMLTAPTVAMVDAPRGLQPSDRLIGARLGRNLTNDSPEVHLLIARVHGSPRLDPNAVKVTLVDAQGGSVTAAEPEVHEVGGQRGTTASIVHRLLPGQAIPVKATLDVDGQVTEMAIEAAAQGSVASSAGARDGQGRPGVGPATPTYTIRVNNQSGVDKSYIIFMPPAVEPGGQTPVYTNVWATFENVTSGAWDSLVYKPDGEGSPAPSLIVAEGADMPGQVIEPPKDVNLATIDFAGRTQTTAAVTQHPDGGFSVAYV